VEIAPPKFHTGVDRFRCPEGFCCGEAADRHFVAESIGRVRPTSQCRHRERHTFRSSAFYCSIVTIQDAAAAKIGPLVVRTPPGFRQLTTLSDRAKAANLRTLSLRWLRGAFDDARQATLSSAIAGFLLNPDCLHV
jgi:hypothetical protein